MNAIPKQPTQIDWVINYVEVNSRPAPSDSFRRLRMTGSEIQIAPAGIELTIRDWTEDGLHLESETETILGKIVQRGNELVISLEKPDGSSLMFVATKSVCEFERFGP